MTRMWMVNPKIMCKNHLLGEHKEIHMLIGSMKKGISVKGYLEGNCLEPRSLKARHDEIVKEMLSRGWNHHTPLHHVDYMLAIEKLSNEDFSVRINSEQSFFDLINRADTACSKGDTCKDRFEEV